MLDLTTFLTETHPKSLRVVTVKYLKTYFPTVLVKKPPAEINFSKSDSIFKTGEKSVLGINNSVTFTV